MNLARFIFFDRRSTEFYGDWHGIAHDAIGSLRAQAGHNPYYPSLFGLVGELSTRSEGFRVQIREVLRCWLAGDGPRTAAERAGVGRKTARRYVEAGQATGLVRDGGQCQLSDELIGAVVAAVHPARASGHGAAWDLLVPFEAQIREWVTGSDALRLTNVHGKLARRGVIVPYRTLHRFAAERCGGSGGGSPRCESPTASRGWSASSTSPGWVRSRTRSLGGGGWCMR